MLRILLRRRTLGWFIALVASTLPFFVLRLCFAWTGIDYFAHGMFEGIFIDDLLSDFSYACVAFGIAYFADMFSVPQRFAQSDRATVLKYLNLFVGVLIILSAVVYVMHTLIEKSIVTGVTHPHFVRYSAVALFLTLAMTTFWGQQFAHTLMQKRP